MELQHGATQELVDRQKELTNGYLQSLSIVEKLQKEAEELHQVMVQLVEEKVRDIEALKAAQAAEEITKIKKV